MTRIGASQVFFNIVASWNADKLIRDQRSSMAVMKAVSLDTFEAILKPLDDFKMMIDQSTDLVRELSQEMGFATIEFEKFFGETHNIETMRDGLLEVGEAYAIAGSEALDAGSRASQVANLIGRGNINLLVEQANILSEISDLGAEDAMRGIIQLQQQTGFMYGDMTKEQYQQLDLARQRIVLLDGTASGLNKLNTVANRSVAMEGDIVHVMSQFAAQGHLVKDSFEAMASMSAVLLEAGEEQGTAGRALRAIYARLGGNINGATDQMEAMGIVIRDELTGNMLPMEQVLKNMSEKGWANMTAAMKQNIAQTVAGNRHYVRFIKLMENYDRFTGLTADGLLELDKASTQAAKAQEALAFQLESATIRGDNLKAMIGESLTPFMIGATKATNDYLEATSQILEGIGMGGETIGRLHSTLKIGEGFIKFGLAVQSVGIGFEMYSSVMKSLNGIQAANENLHSKMANHLEFGVDATEAQKVILKGMQFIQQKINAAKEKERLTTKHLLEYSEEMLVNENMNLAVTERQNFLMERSTDINSRKSKWAQYENAHLAAGNRLYDQREARLKHIGQIDDDLRNKSLALYNAESATQDAMQKQVIADMQVFAAMSDEELDTMRDRNIALGTTHTLLQNIKAENEKARALNRTKEVMNDETGYEETKADLGNFAATIFEEDRIVLQKHFAQMSKDNLEWIEIKKAQIEKASAFTIGAKEQELAELLKLQKGYNELLEGVHGDEMTLSKQGFDAFTKSMKDVQGQRIQTMRGLETHNMAKKDAVYLDKTLNQLKDAAKSIESQWNATKEVSILMDIEDAALKEKLAPLQARINDAKLTEIQRTKELTKMITLLNMEEKDILESAKYNEFNKENEKYQASIKGANNATKRFAFTLSNTAGVLLGTFGDSAGAARASILMFSTNIIGAGVEAGKSAVYMIKMQKALFAVNVQAHGAAAAMTKLKWSIGLMSAALIVVGVGMELFARQQMKAAKASEKLQEEMFEMENLMGRLTADQKLLNDADLAEALGMEDSTLYQLAQDTELAADAFDKLSNHTLVLTNEMNAQIESSLKLLGLFTDLRDGGSILGTQQFEAKKRDVARMMDDEYGYGIMQTETSILGNKDIEYAKKLAKEIGLQESAMKRTDAGMFGLRRSEGDSWNTGQKGTLALIDHIIKNMEKEIQLTEEQLVLFEKIVDNDAIFTVIEQMNMMVMTADSAKIGWAGINTAMADGATEAMNSSNAIKNLTDEIYSFSGAREELFFGGKFGNVTGSLYTQVVKQGVGTLYNKSEIIMNTNFHGFFNEQESADKVIAIVTKHLAV